MQLEDSPPEKQYSYSPARKEIKNYIYETPRKGKCVETMETNISPTSNAENRHTPKPSKSKDFKSNLENQSTEAHLPMFYGSPMLDWKTPQSFLKMNPFTCVSNQSTPMSHKSGNTPNNHTPISPYSDRYIPFRQENISRNIFQVSEKKNILPFESVEIQTTPQSVSRNIYQNIEEEEKNQKQKLYQTLLQENLLNIKVEQKDQSQSVLTFKNNKISHQNDIENNIYLGSSEGKVSKTTQKRKIESAPFKVLDAPGMQDDFYQDVLHWSKTNLIGVGLSQSIYLYNYSSAKVMRITDQRQGDWNYYTSLQWNQSGHVLAIGTYDGSMQFWDVGKQRTVIRPNICQKRIATIAWANSNVFACGSKDKNIMIGDIRMPSLLVHRINQAHSQEVCGLTFQENEYVLASGGNDNKVHIWSLKGGFQNNQFNETDNSRNFLQWTMKDHKAAVRALSWHPNSSGILATGGGSADKTIKISNTLTNTIVQNIEVDSQVCKLKFSTNSNEFVSTHGYEKHQIMVWQYPQPKRIHCFEGHSQRVLYMSLSPDSTTMVTGAGDETLKFWNIFPQSSSDKKPELFKITDFR